jgi:hypothetical protein
MLYEIANSAAFVFYNIKKAAVFKPSFNTVAHLIIPIEELSPEFIDTYNLL